MLSKRLVVNSDPCRVIETHVMDIQIHVMDIQMQKCLSARLRWFLRDAKQSKFAKWEMESHFANQL